MDLTAATMDQLKAEIERRNTPLPSGWYLMDSTELVDGVHEVYAPQYPVNPWRSLQHLPVTEGAKPVLVVARRKTT